MSCGVVQAHLTGQSWLWAGHEAICERCGERPRKRAKGMSRFQGPLTLLVPEQSESRPAFTARDQSIRSGRAAPVDETPRAAKPTHRRFTLRKLADPVRAVICAARVMRDIKNSSPDTSEPTLNWRRFVANRSNLFVWEASGSREYRQRAATDPARLAINRFLNPYPSYIPTSAGRL